MNQKLDVARVFERIFQIYRDQFTLLIPAALAIFVPVALVTGAVYAGDVSIFGVLLVTAVSTVATFWFQGMVVEAAQDILDGRRDHTISSLFRSVTPVLGTLVAAGLLAALATIVGFILLIIPGLIVLTFLALVAPIVVVERLGVVDSFRRSIELVRGNAGRVFSVIVVLFVLEIVLNNVVRTIADSAADSFVTYAVAGLVVSVLIAPLRAVAASVMYFELRGRKEGADASPDTLTAPAATTSPTGGPPPPPAPEAPSAAPQAPPASGGPSAPSAPPPSPAPPRSAEGSEDSEPGPPR